MSSVRSSLVRSCALSMRAGRLQNSTRSCSLFASGPSRAGSSDCINSRNFVAVTPSVFSHRGAIEQRIQQSSIRTFTSTPGREKGGPKTKPKKKPGGASKSALGNKKLAPRLRLADTAQLRGKSALRFGAAQSTTGANKRAERAVPLRGATRARDGSTSSKSGVTSAHSRPASAFVDPTTQKNALSSKDIPLDERVRKFGPDMPVRQGILQLALDQIERAKKTGGEPAFSKKARPTHIQSLAIQHFLLGDQKLGQPPSRGNGQGFLLPTKPGSQTVLGAETGSGKTWAFLFPLLQRMKETEGQDSLQTTPALVRPRAVILAPTHELARQLAASAKSLAHIEKLRVVCLSSGGWLDTLQEDVRKLQAAQKWAEEQDAEEDAQGATGEEAPRILPVDIIVSTPHRLLDVCKSAEERRQAQAESEANNNDALSNKKDAAEWKAQLVSLDQVRAVVVDESDVLFDKDFAPATKAVLHRVPANSLQEGEGNAANSKPPADLIFATASISASLASYLQANHPKATYLLSKGLHQLPKTLETRYVDPGGSRHHALAREVAKALQLDPSKKSKVLVFVEKKHTVELLSTFLKSKGLENVALTGESKSRSVRTNSHLAGFLTDPRAPAREFDEDEDGEVARESEQSNDDTSPRILLSTSLLSRGLDFSPAVSHIFIPDAGSASKAAVGRRGGGGAAESLTALELLHRAGRGARAGRRATLVIFDKDAAGEKRRVLKNKQGRVVGKVVGRVERILNPLIARKR